MDDSVAALHDLITRVDIAELQLSNLWNQWVALTHDEKIAINNIAPNLADVLVRIRP